MPLTKTTDVIDQILAMAPHPSCDLSVPVTMIVNLSQALEAHSCIARREVVEKMFEMCDQKQKITSNKQSSQSEQEKKDDPMKVNLLKYVAVNSSSPLFLCISLF